MTELPDNPRLFVAIELPEQVRAALAELQARLRRHGLDGLRWVRPEGIHLTLKFLGETPKDRVPEIAAALDAAGKGIAPHELALGALGTFGSRNSPRVVWVDLNGDIEVLLRLQRQVDRALEAIGFPRETRPFSPHLTLARIPPEISGKVAGPLKETPRVKVPPAAIHVRELSLILSKLGAGGAVYTRLEAVPLRA